jgi:hypothetical protein
LRKPYRIPLELRAASARRKVPVVLWGILLAFLDSRAAQADEFSKVTYDGQQDELVITMRYRGTNPDHVFSLKWGQCKETAGGHEIAAYVLDSQWQDAERADFKRTARFGLAELSCRPATLTLRTAPHFLYTLPIPVAAVRQR